MKIFTVVVLLWAALICNATAEPAPDKAAADEYNAFLGQCANKENIAACIALMDHIIIEGEHGLVDQEPDCGLVDGTTRLGLRIEFSTADIKEAVIYYLRISRGGKLLRYSDATRYVALFTDRAGLPHPVTVSEGDNFTFSAQWTIKPSSWKEMWKMIRKVRAENQMIKDPVQAFVTAIDREVEARVQAPRE